METRRGESRYNQEDGERPHNVKVCFAEGGMRMAEGTNTITIELPEGILTDLAATPDALAKEVPVAAAIESYREGRITQGQGARIAVMGRAEFLDALFRAKVPACQVTVDELMEEIARAVEANRQRIPTHSVDQGGTT